VLRRLRRSYAQAGKIYKNKSLDQAIELCNYHRKAAIRALGQGPLGARAVPANIDRPREYRPQALPPVLKPISLAACEPLASVWRRSCPNDCQLMSLSTAVWMRTCCRAFSGTVCAHPERADCSVASQGHARLWHQARQPVAPKHPDPRPVG
jgi:hypothetical protein